MNTFDKRKLFVISSLSDWKNGGTISHLTLLIKIVQVGSGWEMSKHPSYVRVLPYSGPRTYYRHHWKSYHYDLITVHSVPLLPTMAGFSSFDLDLYLKQPRKEMLLSKKEGVVTNLTSPQSWIRMYASSTIQLQWTRFQARYGKNNLQITEHTILKYHSVSLTISKVLCKGLKISVFSVPKIVMEQWLSKVCVCRWNHVASCGVIVQKKLL